MADHQQGELIDRSETVEQRAESDLNAPIEWAGLPAFHPAPAREDRLVISFEDPAKRDELVARLGLVIAKKTGPTWSAWYPPRPREDLAALRFDFDGDGESMPEISVDEANEEVRAMVEDSLERAAENGVDPHTQAAADGYGRDIEDDGGL